MELFKALLSYKAPKVPKVLQVLKVPKAPRGPKVSKVLQALQLQVLQVPKVLKVPKALKAGLVPKALKARLVLQALLYAQSPFARMLLLIFLDFVTVALLVWLLRLVLSVSVPRLQTPELVRLLVLA